jgi:hypothetical protein
LYSHEEDIFSSLDLILKENSIANPISGEFDAADDSIGLESLAQFVPYHVTFRDPNRAE